MNITITINTETVKKETVPKTTVEVKDGKAETRTSTIKLYSCDALSDAKIDPKAVIVSVDQRPDEYAIDINEFVKLAHVEQ